MEEKKSGGMTARQFVGIFVVVGYLLGVALADGRGVPASQMLMHKLGHGIPFGLLGLGIGWLVQFFFRSGK